MTRFDELVRCSSGHEAIAFALGAELGAPPPDGAGELLAGLAARLDARRDDPVAELGAVAAVVRESFEVRPAPVLLPQVLGRRGGDPDSLTILGAIVAQRAGLDVDVVSDGDRLYLAHTRLGPPFVADVTRADPLFDGTSLGGDLAWQCGHETAYATLRRVARSSARTGDLATELAALALILLLPLSPNSRNAYEAHHRQLLARLN